MGWKPKTLSKVVRVVLISSTLMSLPMYTMQTIAQKLPLCNLYDYKGSFDGGEE